MPVSFVTKFQFRKVQLRLGISEDTDKMNYVSIPQGTIKTPMIEDYANKNKVSIPQGTIKTVRALCSLFI